MYIYIKHSLNCEISFRWLVAEESLTVRAVNATDAVSMVKATLDMTVQAETCLASATNAF